MDNLNQEFSQNFVRLLSFIDLYNIIKRDLEKTKDMEVSLFLEDEYIKQKFNVFIVDEIQDLAPINTMLAVKMSICNNFDWLSVRDVTCFSNYYVGTSLLNFNCYIDLDVFIRTYAPKSIFFKAIGVRAEVDRYGNRLYDESKENKIYNLREYKQQSLEEDTQIYYEVEIPDEFFTERGDADLKEVSIELDQANTTITELKARIAELESQKQLETQKIAEPKQVRIQRHHKALFALLVKKNYNGFDTRNSLFNAINADLKLNGIYSDETKFDTYNRLIDDELFKQLEIFPNKKR